MKVPRESEKEKKRKRTKEKKQKDKSSLAFVAHSLFDSDLARLTRPGGPRRSQVTRGRATTKRRSVPGKRALGVELRVRNITTSFPP